MSDIFVFVKYRTLKLHLCHPSPPSTFFSKQVGVVLIYYHLCPKSEAYAHTPFPKIFWERMSTLRELVLQRTLPSMGQQR